MAQETFEQAFATVQQLVGRFEANESRYLLPDYQEAEARKDFIDKFWTALGWDVNHDLQTNPYEQEVKVEPSVSMGASQRRADYVFFLSPNFRDPRFYVEAKKPFGDIATTENYFQTIRYGWNGQTPLAVLTDFEQFHIIDCRLKPHVAYALQRRVARYHYKDYASREKFAEIYWLFAREAVADGSIEKRAKEIPLPRGRAVQRGLFPGAYKPVDEAFLEELDESRLSLARSFKAQDQTLDSDTLTELAQRTLDRLVFMRFLEDRGIETSRVVDKFGDHGTAWEDFIVASKRFDSVYNGIVFKRHRILDSPDFRVGDDVFQAICERLSSANSPYDFDAIPLHILGSIYERFLGKVIVATARQVRVEEKPEVRKAGGVYYTPEFIVRYIVEQTVGRVIRDKTPEQIASMRFVDIACGSGSFLLGIYDLLVEHHGLYYNRTPAKARKGDVVERDGHLYLSLKKKREILLNNIFGVDIDSQAVEVAQLSLYLRLLKEETTVTTHQYALDFAHAAHLKKLLPDLSRNVVCGNSLVDTDVLQRTLFAGEEERRLNPMSFADMFPHVIRNGGFDVVVGNPPYISMLLLDKSQSATTKAYWKERYASAAGAFDIYVLFIERALGLVKKGGYVSYIVPNKFLAAEYAIQFRQWLLENSDFLSLADFSRAKVWPVAVYPVVPVFRRASKPLVNQEIQISVASEPSMDSLRPQASVHRNQLAQVPENLWSFLTQKGADVLLEILERSVPLTEVADVWGASTVAEGAEYPTLLIDKGQTQPKAGTARFVVTGSIDRYVTRWLDEPVQFTRKKYTRPLIRLRTPMPERRIEQAKTPKIIIAKVGLVPRAFPDIAGEYVGAYTTYVFPTKMSLLSLTTVLNSRLIQFVYRLLYDALAMGGGYLRFQPPQIRRLPIRLLATDSEGDRWVDTELTRLAGQMVDAKAALAAARTEKDRSYYGNKAIAIDRTIDELVFELYGLSQDQIATVCEQTAPPVLLVGTTGVGETLTGGEFADIDSA